MKHRLPYHNKKPPFKPDPEHWTRKAHSWKTKVAYATNDDALAYLNQHPRLKAQGMIAYQCKVCQMWHIGHASVKKERTIRTTQ